MPKAAMDNLTPSMFYVLMALSKEPLCGIDIASIVDRCTEGRLRLGSATLYTILGKFEKERYIEEISVEGRKRTYRITQKGRMAYEEELTRLRQCIEDAERMKGGMA